MAKELFSNNARSTLLSSIVLSDLSLSVQSGHGARFPTITGSDYFYVTLDDGGTVEIVKCTARATDTFTIVRAQQGTSAANFTSGVTAVELRATKQAFSDLQLTVKEVDGAPSVDAVKTIRFSNGTLTDDGSGQVTVVNAGAPTDGDYWVETANGGLSDEVVVGTTGITTAAYASRQAAAKAGRLFLPNDGFYLERDTGAAWVSWGPLFPFTAPVDADFSWANQGSATVSTTNGGIHVSSPSNGSAQNLRLRVKTLPSAPYTLTMAFSVKLHYLPFSQAFVGVRNSSNDDAVIFKVQNDSSTLGWSWEKWTSNSSGGVAYISAQTGHLMPWPLIWLRIQDDNANRLLSWSTDGQNFIELHSVSRTDHVTPDQFCFGVNPYDQITGITLLSYKET